MPAIAFAVKRVATAPGTKGPTQRIQGVELPWRLTEAELELTAANLNFQFHRVGANQFQITDDLQTAKDAIAPAGGSSAGEPGRGKSHAHLTNFTVDISVGKQGVTWVTGPMKDVFVRVFVALVNQRFLDFLPEFGLPHLSADDAFDKPPFPFSVDDDEGGDADVASKAAADQQASTWTNGNAGGTMKHKNTYTDRKKIEMDKKQPVVIHITTKKGNQEASNRPPPPPPKFPLSGGADEDDIQEVANTEMEKGTKKQKIDPAVAFDDSTPKQADVLRELDTLLKSTAPGGESHDDKRTKPAASANKTTTVEPPSAAGAVVDKSVEKKEPSVMDKFQQEQKKNNPFAFSPVADLPGAQDNEMEDESLSYSKGMEDGEQDLPDDDGGELEDIEVDEDAEGLAGKNKKNTAEDDNMKKADGGGKPSTSGDNSERPNGTKSMKRARNKANKNKWKKQNASNDTENNAGGNNSNQGPHQAGREMNPASGQTAGQHKGKDNPVGRGGNNHSHGGGNRANNSKNKNGNNSGTSLRDKQRTAAYIKNNDRSRGRNRNGNNYNNPSSRGGGPTSNKSSKHQGVRRRNDKDRDQQQHHRSGGGTNNFGGGNHNQQKQGASSSGSVSFGQLQQLQINNRSGQSNQHQNQQQFGNSGKHQSNSSAPGGNNNQHQQSRGNNAGGGNYNQQQRGGKPNADGNNKKSNYHHVGGSHQIFGGKQGRRA